MNKKVLSIILSITTMLAFSGCSKEQIDNYISKIFNKKTETSYISENKEVTSYTIQDTTKETTAKETTTSYYDTFIYNEANLYTTSNLNLREDCDVKSNILDVIEEYNKVELIKENDDWCFVSYNGKEGYVKKDYVKDLGNTFVEVDISDQMLYLYKDNELILDTNVVTGKKGVFDTRLGCNSIKEKVNGIYLEGGKGDYHYKVWVDYWMPFDRSIGLHDATWRSDFSSSAYINGSHGCVNLKYEDAKEIYNNVDVATNVLVHK